MQVSERIPEWHDEPDRDQERLPTLAGTLVLGDGTEFVGEGVGPEGITSGEMVFSTTMTGYQEALTDPSYRGQILLFTYPLIGSYGMAPVRAQSDALQPRAVLLAHLSPGSATQPSLAAALAAAGLPTLTRLDTRSLAQHLRAHGAMPAALALHAPDTAPPRPALRAALARCDYDTHDFVQEVSPRSPRLVGTGRRLLALLDCGSKQRLVEELVGRDVQVVVLPADTPAAAIRDLAPAGVVISNGPGNPAVATTLVRTIRDLWTHLPLFGLCLGHQLLALAAGGQTRKLPFGHRGGNHPVLDCRTGRAFITTQNHGYAVEASSLPPELLVSHRNLQDGTVEGLAHRSLPIRSVQFHPEGAPGPQDAAAVLDDWLAAIA